MMRAGLATSTMLAIGSILSAGPVLANCDKKEIAANPLIVNCLSQIKGVWEGVIVFDKDHPSTEPSQDFRIEIERDFSGQTAHVYVRRGNKFVEMDSGTLGVAGLVNTVLINPKTSLFYKPSEEVHISMSFAAPDEMNVAYTSKLNMGDNRVVSGKGTFKRVSK